MKKQYVSPTANVSVIQAQQILAESLGTGTYGGNTILTRNPNKLWEDDEDDIDL